MNQTKKILIVDDDELTRELIAASLRFHDYDVESVSDGLHAVLHVKEHHPDLIILDVMLPDLSGIEVLNILRSDDQQTPVLMISRLGNHKLQAVTGKLGVVGYLVKPFEIEALIEMVTSLPGFAAEADQGE